MSECRNRLTFNDNFAANGAVTTLGKSRFCAGRCNGRINYKLMSACVRIVGYIAVTAVTGIGCISSFGAGRFRNNRRIAVAGSRNNLCFIAVTANTGSLLKSVLGAGCILDDYPIAEFTAESFDKVALICVSAFFTSIGRGVAAGAEFEYQATDMFSVSFGALYSMQGAKGSLTYKGASLDATCKEDYINIPILANVYVVKGLAVKLGLQPGFNVNDKYHVKAGFAGFSGSGDFDPDEIGMPEAKSVDLSIPVGLSYEYNGFVLDARYNWGVTKLWGDNVDGKNSVFQISLGYKFDL